MRNLTQIEAVERARLLDVTGYDIALDLTGAHSGEVTFRSVTTIAFCCAQPGAGTVVDLAAAGVRSATLNGHPVDLTGWSAERGLALTGLGEHNRLVVDADMSYSTSGQGLHRSIDPTDGNAYLYSQFQTADAQRVYACFDQPDLKSVFTWHVRVPPGWTAVSTMPVERADGTGIHFAATPRMSTYVTALCAGPFHEVRDVHDGIGLGLFCRASLASHLDVAELFTITGQGLDFFHARFGMRYPLPKYDQVWVPDFNAGAMENFGCVTLAEAHFLFRSRVTDFEHGQRANTILHEMAHMWFGNLVTMRWWNDLWLNESFAEWASHWCNAEATRFSDAWTTFLSVRKGWGYRQDQMSSTHPVCTQMPDLDAVRVNFDGITYAKGASVIKQLVAYVGLEPFLAGLRGYLTRYAYANASFDDLLTELERASGRQLRSFAAQWLATAQVNSLRPVSTTGPDGTYDEVVVHQQAPASHPTLRTHRIAIGLYDLHGDRLVRRDRLELDVAGARTAVPALHGVPAADVLLLNDDDWTYAKIRLDERSMATVVRSIAGFDASLPRALCWAAAWDMVRDAELAARDYVALVLNGLPGERDINLIMATLRQAGQALALYADPRWAPAGWRALATTARRALADAEPGGGRQLAWARAYAAAARDADHLAELRGWLDARDVPVGLAVDTELRWTLIEALAANAAAGPADIAAELGADDTAAGRRRAALAGALVATPENKAQVWARLTGAEPLPNWLHRSLLRGFQHPAQVELTAAYGPAFLAAVAGVWASRDGSTAQEFAQHAYPELQVTLDAVQATDAWLAVPGHPAALRRLVAEGRDGLSRALRARQKDLSRSDTTRVRP